MSLIALSGTSGLEAEKRLKSSHMLTIAGVALVATLLVIWQLVSFAQAAPADSQFPITVAIIALIGTLWTGAITFAGLLLKDSVDRRSALLQVESEKRLRMETALRAVELISKAEVEGAPVQESREACLMVIASLNQVRLALTLGEQFWNRDKISSDAFVEIVGQALASNDADLKEAACSALKNNHKKLIASNEGIDFPATYCTNWRGDLTFYAKCDLISALIMAMLSKEFSFWRTNTLNWIIYCLYKMFMNDNDPRFQNMAATYAVELCDVNEPYPGYGIMPADLQKISYDEIRQSARNILEPLGKPENNLAPEDLDLAGQIRSWKDRKYEDEHVGKAG